MVDNYLLNQCHKSLETLQNDKWYNTATAAGGLF